MSIDIHNDMSIDTPDDPNKGINPIAITFDIKVNVTYNKLHPHNDSPVDESLHREVHAVGKCSRTRPWYADIVNYLAADIEPEELRGHTRKKFLREVRRYHWDEPYLYKHCSGGMYRRCSPKLKSPIFCSNAMDQITLDILQPLKRYQKFFRQDSGGQLCSVMLMHSKHNATDVNEGENQ